eukprot:g4100.t1
MAAIEHRFSPYTDNGGTAVGIACDDGAVIIADKRLSKGYSIHTRNNSKATQLTSKCVIVSCGMKADAITLHRMLKIRITMYQHEHRKEPSTTAIAQMLSTTLYGKRFFPYYTFNILAGTDDEGKGACYHYDAIGSFERVDYTTSGSGSSLAHPVIDAVIQQGNYTEDHKRKTPLKLAQVLDLCRDVMTSTGERDIYTGDACDIFTVDKAGVTQLPTFELKKD